MGTGSGLRHLEMLGERRGLSVFSRLETADRIASPFWNERSLPYALLVYTKDGAMRKKEMKDVSLIKGLVIYVAGETSSEGIMFPLRLTFTSNRAFAIPQGEAVRPRNKALAVCVCRPPSVNLNHTHSNGLLQEFIWL